MLSHREARILVCEAFHRQFSREPNRSEAQCLQAVAWLETQYGSGWHGAGVGSHNMGAIQAAGWSGPTFAYFDTHPNADGTSTAYRIAFRMYESDQGGMDDLGRTVYAIHDRTAHVLAPATRGDTLGVSTGLHDTGYYEGFGRTVADRIRHHHEAVLHAISLQALALGEPMPDGSEVEVQENPIPPTLRLGAHSATVGLLQRALKLKDDGIFGPRTLRAVIEYQVQHGLKPDGVVGPATWKSLGVP